MPRRLLPSAALAATLVLSASGQTPAPTFDLFLKAMPWNAATQGPLVAVASSPMHGGATLAAFGRKFVPVGGLTAVVPLRMMVVDSKITESPNFYEGLPQEDKILYLLATLTPVQWQKAAGAGIGIADCAGEQRLVFDSILPNPFRYNLGTILDERSITNSDAPEDRLSLTGDARGAFAFASSVTSNSPSPRRMGATPEARRTMAAGKAIGSPSRWTKGSVRRRSARRS